MSSDGGKIFNRDVRLSKWASLYVADVQIVDGTWAIVAATVPVTTTDLTATGNTILGNNNAVDTVTVNAATSLAGTTTVATNNKILFRDSAIYINSANDGYMDVAADTAIRVATPLMTFATTTGIQFRDSAITIASADDGHLDVTADTSVDINSPLLNIPSAGTIAGIGTGANGVILKNLKNAAASSLSGTQKDIEIDIGWVPYYFTVYPTKA